MDSGEETEEKLNYDFNFNMVLGKTLISRLAMPHEKQLATDWLKKLSTCATAIEELQVRNMCAYLLVLALQEGQLTPPFDSEPPAAPLTDLQHLLPGKAFAAQDQSEYADEEVSGAAHAAHGGGPPAYEYSPDGGAFFAAQPVPRCGAFCYLAVVARQNQ